MEEQLDYELGLIPPELRVKSLQKNLYHPSSFRWIYPKTSIKQALVRSDHQSVGDDDKKSDEDDGVKIQMMSRP